MAQAPSTGSGQAPSTGSGQAPSTGSPIGTTSRASEPAERTGRTPSTGPAPGVHGYLNVLKPPSWTSHDVVARIRRLTGQRRVGHTGTLDPAAAGVLPVALGRATRTVGSPAWNTKLYWADVSFGTSTDTDDAEGRVMDSGLTEGVSQESLAAALPAFIGEIRQRPPSFSAVHVGGQRAYQLARKGATEVAPLPERNVHVDAIAFVGWAPPIASLLIQCRSGTYIRSIARDLGQAVGCPAHLGALVRLRVGPFAIGDAVELETIETLVPDAAWERLLWPVDVTASAADAIIARASRAVDFSHGRPWQSSAAGGVMPAKPAAQSARRPPHSIVRVYGRDGGFMGFAKQAGRGVWQPTLAIPSSIGDTALV